MTLEKLQGSGTACIDLSKWQHMHGLNVLLRCIIHKVWMHALLLILPNTMMTTSSINQALNSGTTNLKFVASSFHLNILTTSISGCSLHLLFGLVSFFLLILLYIALECFIYVTCCCIISHLFYTKFIVIQHGKEPFGPALLCRPSCICLHLAHISL